MRLAFQQYAVPPACTTECDTDPNSIAIYIYFYGLQIKHINYQYIYLSISDFPSTRITPKMEVGQHRKQIGRRRNPKPTNIKKVNPNLE